jgi:hypothetical protein
MEATPADSPDLTPADPPDPCLPAFAARWITQHTPPDTHAHLTQLIEDECVDMDALLSMSEEDLSEVLQIMDAATLTRLSSAIAQEVTTRATAAHEAVQEVQEKEKIAEAMEEAEQTVDENNCSTTACAARWIQRHTPEVEGLGFRV